MKYSVLLIFLYIVNSSLKYIVNSFERYDQKLDSCDFEVWESQKYIFDDITKTAFVFNFVEFEKTKTKKEMKMLSK